MSPLMISLLGAPRLLRDGAPVALVRAKAIALLTYLAIMRSPQPRERLLDLLWPESHPQAARKNMRNTLWAIGEALGHDALQQRGQTLELSAAVAVDLHALEDGVLLLESGSASALEQAASHYRGPLADGLALREAPEFELWLMTERERLLAIYLRLLEQSIALHQATGAWDLVAASAQRALAADPLRESLALALIEAQIRMGRRAQAAHQYELLAEALRRDLDVAPLPETAARYQALLANVAASAPPPVSALAPAAPAPRLVGRAAELAALSAARDRVASSGAQVVAVSGDLGMGKSRLWQAWAEGCAGEALVLSTYALEAGDPMPFGPLLTLMRSPGPLRALLQPPSPLAPIWLAELSRLAPEIGAAWPQLPAPLALTGSEERARLLRALVEPIRALARPLVALAIDDLHWADPSTLDWLAYLVDQMRAEPLLLVLLYRPQDASDRLSQLLAGWLRQGRLSTIALPPLTEDEASALVAASGAVDTRLAAGWVRQSGGNPYYLIELRRAASAAPPEGLADLLRARLRATVPISATQVLQAAAVLGDGAEFAAIRATGGRSEEETLDALDTLVSASVLALQAGGYHFVHPLVATVTREDLAPARRAFLHRRAAQALERAPQPERVAGQLMEHLAAAGDLDQAAAWADRASAQALAVGAAVEAAGYAQRALAWGASAQRHMLLGEALAMVGTPAAAHDQLEAALDGFAREGNVVGIARAAMRLGTLGIATSRPDVARAWLARVPIAQVRALDPALGIELHQLGAGVERLSQSYAAAAAQLVEAERLADLHQLVGMRAQIAFERGNLLSDSGDQPGALASFQRALQLAAGRSDPVLLAMIRNNLAYHTQLSGDSATARAHLDAALATADQYALGFLRQYLHSTAATVALAEGLLDDADRELRAAFEAARAWENLVHMANVRTDQALVALRRGDRLAAHDLLAQAHALLGDALDPFVRAKLARVGALLGSISPLPS